MKLLRFITCSILTLALSASLFSFLVKTTPAGNLKFPYKQMGLSNREAAAHLLSRFTYGAKPGQVDSLLKIGLENWFLHQLNADLNDDSLAKRLSVYDAINLSNTEICALYPKASSIIAMAIKDSAISKDSVGKAVNKKLYNSQVQAYMQRKGLKAEQDLYKQFMDQNIARAVYTNNQLQEVLTDFWFNHFNVSFTKTESAHFIPAYERDVIRPHVFGNFDQLLLATAKSPAMLYFLDNFISVAPLAPKVPKENKVQVDTMPGAESNTMMGMMEPPPGSLATATPAAMAKVKKNVAGLNENYAREVMELHTLGVDGGYTQADVTEAARILTGWTVYPIATSGSGSIMKSLVDKVGVDNLEQKGYVREGDFLFTPGRHDQGEKTVLGHHFGSKGGYQEGIELLEMLAHHASAAKFICRKVAIHFVCDNPPQSLLDKLSKSFMTHDGNIKEVLITLVNSTEFWDKKYIREKIKSPFELAVSAARALNANVQDPYPLYNWIAKMGQKVYYYQAPTGFPDKAQYWVSAGALLNRMNFSLAFSSQQIQGTSINLTALTNNHEPENARQALETYCKLLMPERKLDNVIKQLSPLLDDPELAVKVKPAISKASEPPVEKPTEGAPGDMMTMGVGNEAPENKAEGLEKEPKKTVPVSNNPLFCQVVGIIIGSPEFQRR